MVREFWVGAALIASALAGASVAQAADLTMPVKAPVYKAPPYVSNWSGFYIGANGGYGWGDTSFDNNTTIKGPGYEFEKYCQTYWRHDYLTTSLNGNPKGGLYGGHAGYNWQYGSIVTGLEGDFDGADISESGSLGTSGRTTFDRSIKFDELATVRARLGYTVLPNLLAYGTAGGGWGHSELTVSATSPGGTGPFRATSTTSAGSQAPVLNTSCGSTFWSGASTCTMISARSLTPTAPMLRARSTSSAAA